MEKEIFIESDFMKASELYENLEITNNQNIEYILLREQNRTPSLSTEVLVALISLSSVTISTLLTSLINLVGKRVEKHVVVSVEDKESGKIHLEFSSQMNESDILKLVKEIKQINVPLLRVNKKPS